MTSGRARVVVIGNEKGGTGKSTVAMHLIVALLATGRSVASIDLDVRQRSLTRYLENRRVQAETAGRELSMPAHGAFEANADTGDTAQEHHLATTIRGFSVMNDVIIIDTPGNDTALTRFAHGYADTLITPINDSFVDLDVLARVDGKTMHVDGPGRYAEMVAEQRRRRAARDGREQDWIVARNRLSSLDARNKRRVEHVLREMSDRLGFRLVAGFGERVIYRELFPFGLTLMDLGPTADGQALTLSHVAARQEVRALVEALLSPAEPASARGA